MSKRRPRGSLAVLRRGQGQLGETQEEVKAQTSALPSPAGIARKSSDPYQPLRFSPRLTVLTAVMADAEGLNFSAVFLTSAC